MGKAVGESVGSNVGKALVGFNEGAIVFPTLDGADEGAAEGLLEGSTVVGIIVG